jgi:hypothetical protein
VPMGWSIRSERPPPGPCFRYARRVDAEVSRGMTPWPSVRLISLSQATSAPLCQSVLALRLLAKFSASPRLAVPPPAANDRLADRTDGSRLIPVAPWRSIFAETVPVGRRPRISSSWEGRRLWHSVAIRDRNPPGRSHTTPSPRRVAPGARSKTIVQMVLAAVETPSGVSGAAKRLGAAWAALARFRWNTRIPTAS